MKLQFIQRYHADVEVGAKLTLDGAPAVKTMKEFKQEIKSANEELLNTSARFGATSKEALAAAKRVAELKDNIADANETAKLFDPGNKFQVLGNAVRGLVGGFTALQGALALVGVEGDEVQKTLLKVQGALALTEGLNVIADVTKDFQRLGSVLVQTLGKSGLIGVAIAGVAALGLAFAGVFSKEQSLSVKAVNDSLKDYSRAAGEARQKTVEVKVAFEQARAGVISKEQALKVYNDTLGDSLGKTNDINQAEKILADKAETYIKITALKAQANALFAKAAESAAEALINQQKLVDANIQSGGITGAAVDAAQSRITKTLEESKKIEAIGTDLLKQAGVLSQQFNINTGGPKAGGGGASTPKVAAAKAEEAELDLFYASTAENRLLRQQELQAKLLANRQAFIDNGMALEEQDLREKIDLLNLELDAEENATRQRIAYAEMERDAKIQSAQAIGNALGALADLVGKQTAAGKALAVAQAVINTWVGVSEVLSAKSVLPEPIATISKIANVAAIVATGIVAVKNILKTKVPGGSGGGGGASVGSLQSSAPIRPQAPAATNTLLNQQQLNQIGNATVRAYVTENDITNSQERVRRLNRAARL